MKALVKKIVGLSLLMIILVVNNIPITAATSDKPILEIESINIEQIYAGEEAELEIQLSNVGYYAARKLEIRLETDETSPISIVSTTNRHFISTLNPNYSETLTYKIKVDKDAVEDFYALDLTIDYFNTDDDPFSVTEKINLNVLENEDNIQFTVTKAAPTEEVIAGQEFDLVLDVKNDSGSMPKEIYITLDGLSTDTLTNTSINEHYVEKMSPTVTRQVTFSLYASSGLTEGVYPVSINIEYENQDGQVKTKTFEVFIKVEEDEESDLVVKNIKKSHSTVVPEQDFTLNVDVENISMIDAENIEVYIEHDQELVPVSQSKFVIQDLAAGASQTVSFTLEATDNAVTQNYPITVYVDYNNGEESIKQYTGINVSNDDEDVTFLPRLIISQYSTDVEQLYVGESFDLGFTLLNTSDELTVKNVKVSLSTDGDTTVFMPVGQSNSLFINQLSPGEDIALNIPLKIIASAESKIYALDVTFEYQDEDGIEYSDNESINIQVYQDTEITVSDVRIGKILDSSYTLEVDFFNTGKVDISNLMVDIEGIENAQNSNYYVGDFSTGRTDIYDVVINGSVPKPLEGKVVFTYDNTFGEKVVVEKPFSIANQSGTGSNKMGGGASAGGKGNAGGALEGMDTTQVREAFANGEITKEEMQKLVNGETTSETTQSNLIWIAIPAILIILVVIIIWVKKRKKG